MASKTSGSFCMLCICFPLEISDIEMTKKIEKYLQIKVECTPTGICRNCYNALNEFHEFYEKIHLAQKNLIIKTQKVTFESELNPNQKTDLLEVVGQTQIKTELSDTIKEEVVTVEVLRALKNIKENNEVVLNENDVVDEKIKGSNFKKSDRKSKKFNKNSGEIEKKMLEFYSIKCEKCDYGEFTSFKMLNKHYVTVHRMHGYVKCCKRNIRVNDKYYLRSHMFKHLQPETCRCRECGKELSSVITLKNHMILHRPAEERPFQCSECSKGFCCKNDLRNHERAIHLPENKKVDFICDVCGKLFKKAATLKYHHSAVHLQERKFICEICAKCFTTQNGLRIHKNATHTTSNPVQCPECNKWLKTKGTLQKHLQLHQNNSYPCMHCSKVCNSTAGLRSHLVKHSIERPFTCDTCKKSFKTKTHLKNHSAQHFGGQYKCPYCSKSFISMSNFYTHRRRIHSAEAANKQKSKPAFRIVQRDDTVMNEGKVTKNENQNVLLSEVSTVNQNVSPAKY